MRGRKPFKVRRMSVTAPGAMPAVTEIRNLWLCPIREQAVKPKFCSLLLSGGKIRAIRPADFRAFLARGDTPVKHREPPTKGNTPPEHREPSAEGERLRAGKILDAGGRVATPPLANFHEHFYSRLSKGLSLPGPLDNFKNILESFWWQLDRALDRDMVEACARLGVLEAIRNGVTCVFDHHSSPSFVAGSLELIAEVLSEAGLRGVLCLETSDRHGNGAAAAALQENLEFGRDHSSGDIRCLAGLHAPFTLSDDTLAGAASLCRELDIGIHTHLAEDRLEQEYSRERFGIPPALRLSRFGLLSRPGVLAHGVHLGPEDFEAIAQGGCGLALNPDSNLNNAVGLARFAEIPARVPVLAGTDGMHASPARSLKQLFLLHRHQGNGIPESFNWIRRIFFDQVAFLRRFFPDYPELQEGERADLVVWDYRPPSPLNRGTFWGHLVYGLLESPAWSVLANGRPLMAEGRLLSVDAEATARAAARQGERLFERLGAAQYG